MTRHKAIDRAVAKEEAATPSFGAGQVDMPETVVAEEPAAESATPHGSINAMVKDLLTDPNLSYEAIVDRVKAAYPSARTTARSVVSTACVMRRRGETVPIRRRSKP